LRHLPGTVHIIGRISGALIGFIVAFLLWTRIADGLSLTFTAWFGLVFGSICAFIGIRKSWPVWTAGYLGLMGMAVLFWIPVPFQNPVLAWILYLVLLVALTGIANQIWQGDGTSWIPLSLFPCSLFVIRIWLVDILAWNLLWSWIMTLVALAVYAVAISVICKWGKYKHWILGTSSLLYFLVAVIAMAGTINLQAHVRELPLLALLAASPFLAGWQLSRLRFGTREWGWGVAVCLIGLSLLPWYGGDLIQDTKIGFRAQRPVIIDTDMSHDDMVAILYLLQQSDIDVRAITISNGVAHVKNGDENMRRLLALAERNNIPVAIGPVSPLNGSNSFPPSLRFVLDYALRPGMPLATQPTATLSAPDMIRQQLGTASQPVMIIALGPLTNIALALRGEPNMISHIDTLVISGGAVHVPGVVHEEDPSIPNTVSELNLFVDPVAASEVFNSGARLELVPLDVTHNTGAHPILTSRSFIAKFAASAHTRSTRFMADVMQEWLDSSETYTDAVPLWDAPVAAMAMEPSVCSDWQEMAIEIQTEDVSVDGQTVVTNGKPNTHVCLEGDQAAFDAAFLAVAK